VGTQLSVMHMAIQLTYRNTGIGPDDVTCAWELGKLRKFRWKYRENNLQWMLYPEKHPGVSIQIERNVANVWVQDFHQRDGVEDLLNGIFADGENPTPFKDADIMLNVGELRKIVDSPLGFFAKIAYYNSSTIVEAVDQYIKNVGIPSNSFGNPQSRKRLSKLVNYGQKTKKTKSNQLFPSIFDYF